MNTRYIKELPNHWLPIEKVFSALGDQIRQKILLLFEPNEEISIKTIVETIGLSRSAVVHHLKILEEAKLLVPRKQGRELMYKVNYIVALEAVDKLKIYIQEEFNHDTN
ncbi:ArsR/SmtB family transcription factor [Desulfovibrio litoralis]|uniref:DNA-binding transcriptional regulator, ArsR family n=1 Tax=Desulfovibrio litoralis DSM 11393 TaxID=1121455 RepID=A0A1M7TMF8_9BACT|nr:metalloregulator ArsR/SmtB family transcription factor [Desulfovibrio litoralis]SHN71951.1 DNA-binding transcriptional regulator, ArsR family [Desulfovibrio litoralis DSM 11393]